MKYADTKYMKMKFGKHKNKFLSEIPDDYIIWAIKNLDYCWAETFAIEYQRRYPKQRKSS